jgi:hypothetical protein
MSTSGEESDGDKGWNEAVVAEGETTTISLLAPARGTLTGRVRESGKPLVGATVRLNPRADDGPDFGFLGGGSNAVTNSSGEYVLDGLTVADYRVTITHASRAMSWEGETSLREGPNRYDVELPVAIVEGRISGEDKKPLAGVKVRAERARNEDNGQTRSTRVVVLASEVGGEAMSFTDDGGAPPVITDSEGRYRLRGVTPEVGLNVVASSPGVQTARSDRIKLAPDQTLTGVDLVLKLGANVEVVTRRPDGKGSSGCIVTARALDDEQTEPKTQFVGSTGRVTFSGLQPGHWRFSCQKPGFNQGPGEQTQIPDQEIEVKVGTPRTVTFDVPE